jgi:hypothetical protein
MTAQATPVRVERVQVRRASSRDGAGKSAPGSPDDGPVLIDLVGGQDDTLLAAGWARLRELWAQTTFYLFDADSWRR